MITNILRGVTVLCFVSTIAANDIWPANTWTKASPDEVGMDAALLDQARAYAETGGGSGYITRHGRLVLAWGDLKKRYDLKSTTKSFGATALGIAVGDGKLALDDRAIKHHPNFGTPPEANSETGWLEEITIKQLAAQTAGFAKPGGYEKLLFAPGTHWHYSDGGPNWLAECVTLAYRRDLQAWMFDRVFTPIGIQQDDLKWRRHQYRDAEFDGIPRREFGSGIHANVDAMARFGLLYLREGRWRDKQLVPAPFIALATAPLAEVIELPEFETDGEHGNASAHYGLLWWNNADGRLPNVPRDAYWTWGLYDSLIVVIPSLDVAISRAGRSWKREKDAGHYDVLAPFLEPIVRSVTPNRPRSPVIAGIDWAPPNTIIRKAKGGDNWPITWGADDRLYTAYGDGWGFEPKVEKKLSMGLAIVTGEPNQFHGENLRSETAERLGQGKEGPKVSGLLMVEGVLYMLVRNTDNAQLAWSEDQGKTWTWADWKFTDSFAYPTFLNFGKNYAGARDDFVYIYSHDEDSAYERADTMVLARVPKDALREQSHYQYFQGSLEDGSPTWTADISNRWPVFDRPGTCYRSSVSYNAALKRYLWCQTGLGEDTRIKGGFAIYDAPEPWGPWTTVYETSEWDVGPGETSCLPTKWMSANGLEMHLVFSGDDSFSVRRGTLRMRERPLN